MLGQVTNNSLLVFDNYAAETFGGTISGSGAVTKSGLGLLTFTNSSSYNGGTTISAGTLVLGSGQAGQDGSLAATGLVSDNSVFAFNYAANETFAGAISGNGALATLGSHTLTLTNIETYGGPTTISAGTLQLGNGIASGAVAGNIANNSALVLNSPSAQTYGGIISGSGSIATIGGNYLALTGKSTNSGSVTVSGGTLSLVGGSLYSNLNYVAGPVITVNNGGAIVVSAWSDADSNGNNGAGSYGGLGQLGFTNTNLVINGGTIRYVGNGPNNGNTDRGFVIGASGATLDASGGATFTLSVGNRGLGIINNAANGPLTLEGTTNGLLGMAYSGASNLTKNGPGTWTISNTNNTYSGGTTVNGGALIAGNTGALPGYTAGGNIVVNPGATLAVTAGTNAGEFSLTSGGAVDQVLNNATFGAGANLGLLIAGTENVGYGTSIADTINGSRGFMKLGTGVLSLTGNNTYSGGTQVNGGVLIATSVNSLGSSGGGAPSTLGPAYQSGGQIFVNNAGSTLVVQAGTSPGEFQSSDVLERPQQRHIRHGHGLRHPGRVQRELWLLLEYSRRLLRDAGMGFYKLGAGTLTLAAQNNYSGTTTISAGVLVAAAAGALGNGTAIQLGDLYTGSGAPSTLGLAQLLISGANTFPQNITVNAANATLGNIDDNNAGFGGNITLNSSLTIASASVNNALTFSGNIVHGSGTNSVTLTGPGNVVFLGNATYQGATTVNGGNLTVGATGSLPSTTTLNINSGLSTVTFSNTAQTLAGLNGSVGSTLALAYGGGATLTVGSGSFAGAITDPNQGGANLVKTTTGTLYLTGANTYYGLTTVTAGALLYGSLSDVSTVGLGITVSTSGAVGLESSGLGGLLLNLTSGSASNGTLVVTMATSADAVNLGTYSLNYLSLGALDSETYTGLLTPSGTNYRLGGGGGTLTFAPALTGSLGLLVNGPASGGKVILTSTGNTYSGPTVVSYGTLQVGDAVTTNGSLPNNAVTDNGALVFANPSNMTFAGVIGGNGQLAETGSGALILTAAESYSGPTTISAGTLQLNNGGFLNAASTITDNGMLAFNNSGTLTQGTNFSSARSRAAEG